MGLLADFVVAKPEDALQYEVFVCAGNAVPLNRFGRCEYKNFTPVALELLWAILRGQNGEMRLPCLEHVCHTSETWLHRFPDELVDLLSTMDEETANRAADVWSRSEEVPGNSEELSPVLRDLRKLAIDARMSAPSLYLWVSL